MTALTQRDAQRQHDARCDCCGDSEGEWLDSLAADYSESAVAELCFESGVGVPLLEALIYAWRTGDWMHAERLCNELAGPVIQKAARDEAERMGERP